MTRRVAIIGAAHRFPGTTSETFWQDLQGGKDMVTRVAEERWSQEAYQHPDRRHPGTSVTFAAGSLGDVSGFDAAFFGISPREAANMDPQQRLLLELAWEAMEDAGVPPSRLRGSHCGVFVGIASLDYFFRMADDPGIIDASTATGNASSIASNRISYVFDLHGPSMSLDTACSSSLVAFHQACQAIRSGETDMALAGGISLHLHPYGFVIFSKASMLSATGRCQVFDADGDGYVRSEGAGLFLLKDHEQALADGDRILAVVAGSAVNTDGHKSGLTVPSPAAQAALMRQAYCQAGIAPDEIDYLEAHGTGTPVGDPIETRAIGDALARARRAPLPIGSVKGNLGHLETASGVAGLAKALYSLRHREVPATIGIRTLNPNIKLDDWNLQVVTEPLPLKPEGRLVIGVNSFGFGGANAHVILESPPEEVLRPAPATAAPLPLRLTARSVPALRALAGRLAAWLQQSEASLYDIAYTLQQHRDHHREGALLFAQSKAEAARLLAAFADPEAEERPAEVATGLRQEAARGPAFVYAGNGCQWEAMGAELLASSPTFAAAVDEVDALFQRLGEFSLRAELEGRNGTLDDGESRLARTEIAQPALFALQVGLTALLREHGIEPRAVVGHSVGEVAAAWASGALALADAVRVIHYRSHYQGLTRGQGEMSAVAMGAEEIGEWLARPEHSAVCLAGINSPRGVTLAGPAEALARLEQALGEGGTLAKRLPLDYAFHSPAMDPIESGVIEALAGLAPGPERVRYVSTVTGAPLAGEALDAAYWWHNIRQPVRFEAALGALIDDGINTFIEIGAHPILRRYLNEALRDRQCQGTVITTLERESTAGRCMTQAVGQALLSGIQVDARRWFPEAGARVELPRYPWQREHYWLKGTGDGMGLLTRHYAHPLLGYPLAQQANTWESQLDTGRLPWLADHVVGEGAVFPGAGFVEVALAAARQANEVSIVDIEELEIRAPLLLDGPNGRRLRTRLEPETGRLSLHSREPQSGSDWQLNAVARLMAQSRGFLLRRPAPARPARAPDVTLAQHLVLAERLGLHYGPAFQAIGHCWVEDDSVIGEIDLPEAIATDLDSLHLHPGILDSAFQLFLPLLAHHQDKDDGLAFVPVRVGRLQYLPEGGVPTLAQASLRRRSPHSFTADFALFDARGQAVAVLSETRFKAVRLKRQHHQRFAYLDVALTPAPRQPAPLDPAPLLAALPALLDDLARATAGRFADEVDPLLDSLAEAFAAEALQGLAGGPLLSHARYRELTRQRFAIQPLLDQLLQLLEGAGRLSRDEHGWTLADDEAAVAADTIWQLLLRDYPDDFAPIQRLGRFGLHLPALLEGAENAESLALDPDGLAPLTRQLLGEEGWQALAGGLRRALAPLLAGLPADQRLRLLEAGTAAPAIGERLCDLFDPDRCDYRILAVDEASWQQAEQLQERYPLIDIERLDAPAEAAAPAQLALVTLEPGHRQRSRRLLEALPARLAPGAPLLVLGLHPSAWLDTLLLTPGLEDDGAPLRATEPEEVMARLESLGATDLQRLPLGEAGRGAYLLHARMPATKAPQAAPACARRYRLVADAPGRAIAEPLAAALRARGHEVAVVETPTLPTETQGEPQDVALPTTLVDLRQAGERCAQAARWPHELEAFGEQAELWLVTRGVAAMWGQGEASEPAADAALWGFGRSLANESAHLRLLDLPAGEKTLTPDLLAALVTELAAPDAENEIVLDAQGRRYATRLRPLPAPGSARGTHAPPRRAMTLGFPLPGQLRNLTWQPRALPEPAAGEVEVAVRATGLNFRDVMYTLGLLSDEAIENGFAGPSLGLEFSGSVVAVGPGVEDLAVGDAVVGFGPASFSDRVIAARDALAPIPEGLTFAAAATIPTTFFTVYYALKHLARLAPGESVLIHGAAGGVGIAAIQVAQWLGAEIHATAGSDEKRDFLRLMGVTHLYDSRALTFGEEILEATGGRGVDVVLNSLAGEAINQNLRALRPFGRFLELGKRDFYENTHIGLRPFRNNLSYFGIDSDQLMKEQPALTGTLFAEMMALFRDGTLSPLPYTAFSARQVVAAFRYMQQARQIGKVVVTREPAMTATDCADALPDATLADAELTLPAEASYLVTGGLGGFGLKSARWLANRGARHLILVGRSGAASEEAQAGVAALRDQGVRVTAAACDITDRAALARLLDACRETHPPLRGVIHAATVIDDGLVRNLDAERIRAVLAPKIDGARHLDALTRDAELDFFVLYSSATTLFGNPGQASYVAANHWLEALAASRRARGLPASCLRWGAIDDVGFLARHTRTRDALQERLGGDALHSDEALAVLERLLVHHGDRLGGPSLGVLELEWHALARFLPTADAPRFGEIARAANDGDRRSEGNDNLAALFAELPPEELQGAVTDLLRAELAGILLIDEEKIDVHRSVYEMGFDSLMGVELMTAIESRLGVQVPVMVLSEASTLDKLAGVLIQRLQQQEPSGDDQAEIGVSLAARHGVDASVAVAAPVEEAHS